ncbi:MAG: tetratricopeptide repeat protein [Bauldia sp.]|nr:tetratricopeptide repeat protein [Bauldia sp.]
MSRRPTTVLPVFRHSGSLRRGAVLAPIALALALGACSKTTSNTSPEMTGAIAKPITQQDFQSAVSYWAPKYEQDPKSKAVALNYSSALTRVGQNDQAVAILQKAAIYNPNDREVLAAYGKALAAEGDLPRALEIVQRAQTPDQPDWKLLSAEAAIRDQLGDHNGARQLYAKAGQIAPNEPSIQSNLGMSYVLTGELADAERVLRQAAAMPGADSRVRQNLALVVGLSGRFSEAEKIAGAELSPDQAATNVAYLKSMLQQPNNWEKLKTQNLASAQ